MRYSQIFVRFVDCLIAVAVSLQPFFSFAFLFTEIGEREITESCQQKKERRLCARNCLTNYGIKE